MKNIKDIAIKYFDAFHRGDLKEVYTYLSKSAVVKYGTEPEQDATEFFPQTREMISQFKFETLGVYTSYETRNVIVHFAFEAPGEQNDIERIEALDIIAFSDESEITKITVIPNG